MDFLDLTLDTPVENLALDEALLDWAEAMPCNVADAEALRIWEPAKPFVVLGRSSRITEEVDLVACQDAKLPILRRSSGGATVIAGPGCLMYAVVLSYDKRPELRAINQAHRFVLEHHVAALKPIISDVATAGTSDLVFGEEKWKFSGNSLRCKRTHLCYHGTLLYDFDVSLIAKCLRSPPRQPDYRGGRTHSRFVANLPATRKQLTETIRMAWNARQPMTAWPRDTVDALVRDRYGVDSWTVCFP